MHEIVPNGPDIEYYTVDKAWMLPYVAPGPNIIMDLGCASGRFGDRLRQEGKAERLIGVEIFGPAAEIAARIYNKIHVGDVEQMDLPYKDYFDYVVCGDILEHLRDPDAVLVRIMRWLKPGGSVLVCLPNIRNYRILVNLSLYGRWEYQSSGILDRTHLRFFTRSSCKRMLTDAQFEVYHEHMVIYGSKKFFVNRITFTLFDEFLATQVFCCGKRKAL